MCYNPDDTHGPGQEFSYCKWTTVNYDYAGLSNQVIAERQGPYVENEGDPDGFSFVGDKFVSTYTYGPLGLLSRTDERLNPDPSDNRQHYYLADVNGGNIGLWMDDDGDPVGWHAFTGRARVGMAEANMLKLCCARRGCHQRGHAHAARGHGTQDVPAF